MRDLQQILFPPITFVDDIDDDDSGRCDCGDCDVCDNQPYERRYDDDDERLIKNYMYKPAPRFHGDGPLYLGMELEISTDYDNQRAAAVTANRQLGPLGYLKDDGSIYGGYGFELVTHPMTYEWATDQFPWQLLTDLHGMGCRANRNGLHVHVSRAGFDSPMHIFRWLKFFYRNEDQVTRIARRSSGEWASFDRYQRQLHKHHAKGNRAGARYSAINTCNEDTFEVRVFRGAMDRQKVLAALGLVTSTVEYTRSLTVRDITQNGGWRWPAFASWITDQPQFAPLAQEMERLECAC